MGSGGGTCPPWGAAPAPGLVRGSEGTNALCGMSPSPRSSAKRVIMKGPGSRNPTLYPPDTSPLRGSESPLRKVPATRKLTF